MTLFLTTQKSQHVRFVRSWFFLVVTCVLMVLPTLTLAATTNTFVSKKSLSCPPPTMTKTMMLHPHAPTTTETTTTTTTINKLLLGGVSLSLPLSSTGRMVSVRGGGEVSEMDNGEEAVINHPNVESTNTLSTTTSVVTTLLSLVSSSGEWVGHSAFRCWALLLVAVVIEIGATTLLKLASDMKIATRSSSTMSNTNIGAPSLPSSSSIGTTTVAAIALYVCSLLSFGVSLQQIDVSVAYAVWSGLGTAAVSLFGIMFWNESKAPIKLCSLAFILIGVVGLNLSSEESVH